jgi:tetratricopeptide (TPR) repeat protein
MFFGGAQRRAVLLKLPTLSMQVFNMFQFPFDPEVPSDENNRVNSLMEFYRSVSGASYENAERGRQQIKAFLPKKHTYTGPVDVWFNLSAEAGRLGLQEEGFHIAGEGLEEHPNNVDLLCDRFQDFYALFKDPQKAQEIWKKLESLEHSKYYWRYWTYGAIYHSTMLRDQEKALGLLESGLNHVSSDHINDIIRAYRRVLIDSPPSQQIQNRQEREMVERQSFEKMKDLYEWAISLGVEDGYSLAVNLAELYQERAASQSMDNQTQEDFLQQALKYLDLAEKMFTGSPNHPVWEIYLPKATVLMGLHRYADALNIFHVLPKVAYTNPSYEVQKRLAARMLGEKEIIEEPNIANIQPTSLVELISESPQKFFSELTKLISSNSNVRDILIQILQQTTPPDEEVG